MTRFSPSIGIAGWLIILFVLITGITTTIFSKPFQAEAAGTAADAMCNPVIMVCGCGQIMVSGKCQGGANMFQCPCMDTTNGFTTPGTCVAPNKCSASGGGMPPMPPMLPMPPMPMPSPSMPSDPCSSGVGGIAGIIPGNSSSSTSAASSTCPSNGTDSSSFPSFDTTSFNTNTGSSNDGSIPDLVSSLLNGNVSASANNTPASTPGGSIVPGATTTQVARAPFGSAEGVTGDVQVQGLFVRVLASNRNSARGTQVSGFYGFQLASSIAPATVFKNLCSLRPWSANFMSFIVPSDYFDALCTARNYAVGFSAAAPATTKSSSGTTTGAPKTSTSNTPAATATQYLGKARVDIWATPATIASGQRSSIFWDATGVSACSISSSDRAFTGSSLSGHAATQPLTKSTTYSITCQTATSTVSNQVVVAVQ